MRKKTINPDAWYNLSQVATHKMFPWCHSFVAVRYAVNRDLAGANILKTVVTGEGRATKYHIKGENIIKFIEAWEAGTAIHKK